MNATLIPARYIRFAVATDSYDPICFDLNHAMDGDCPIIRLEHESILVHDSIGESDTVFTTFRKLITAVINSAR